MDVEWSKRVELEHPWYQGVKLTTLTNRPLFRIEIQLRTGATRHIEHIGTFTTWYIIHTQYFIRELFNLVHRHSEVLVGNARISKPEHIYFFSLTSKESNFYKHITVVVYYTQHTKYFIREFFYQVDLNSMKITTFFYTPQKTTI